jgi:hypothetical protein
MNTEIVLRHNDQEWKSSVNICQKRISNSLRGYLAAYFFITLREYSIRKTPLNFSTKNPKEIGDTAFIMLGLFPEKIQDKEIIVYNAKKAYKQASEGKPEIHFDQVSDNFINMVKLLRSIQIPS